MRRDWGVTARLVEHRPDWSIPVAEALALPGDLVVVAFVLAVLYLGSVWRRRSHADNPLCAPETATTIGIVLAGLALVVFLESIVGAGRPPTEWQAIEPSPYGFPSGHTMAATVLWGAIAWRHWSAARSARVLAVIMIVGLVGFSRLLLGVHYLPDVLAAIAVGILYLAIAFRVTDDHPTIAFAGALGIGIAALFVSGGGSRATLAVVGTLVIAFGWYITEREPVRRRLRRALAQVPP